jgi:hypothetical protein
MILIEFSHILTFSMLFIAAIFDLRSEMGDVPDEFGAIAIVGGIILHAVYSYSIESFTPLIYCIAVGTVLSAYGWLAYWKGMWGGADALGLSALGFGAPFLTFSMEGVITQTFSLFVNIVLIATLYTLGFSLVRAYRTENFREKLKDKFQSERKRIALELGLATVVFAFLKPFLAALFYIVIASSVLLLRFLRVVEDYAMTEEVEAEELEGGEVVRENKSDKIKGVTEEEIEEIEDSVEVMHGIRFMPVFPAALILTNTGFSMLGILIGL